jgi:hypothetical protein
MTTLSVSEATVKDYNLSITTRDFGDDPVIMEELTYATVKTWLWVVNHLEQEAYTLPTTPDGDVLGSVEQILAARITDTDGPKTFPPTGGDARVTVWDTYRGNKRISFHLDSDDIPQVAVNLWVAQRHALERIFNEFAAPQQQVQKAAQSSQDAQKNGATDVSQPSTVDRPATPRGTTEMPKPIDGTIIATRAPNPKEKTYQDGQLVEFSVNKIVLGTHPTSGSVIYSLWGDLGKKYALKTVYVMASNGTDKSYDYQTAAQLLESLSLSIPGKVQAEGNWKLICKAANSGDKQYMNIVSLY